MTYIEPRSHTAETLEPDVTDALLKALEDKSVNITDREHTCRRLMALNLDAGLRARVRKTYLKITEKESVLP